MGTLFFAWSSFPALVALACSPAPPDPWFRVSGVSFGPLPSPGIHLTARSEHRTWFVDVENADPEPLYIVGAPSPPGSSYARPNAGVPVDRHPFFKVTSNQAFEWVSKNEARTRTDEGSWQPYRRGRLELMLGQNMVPKPGQYRNLSPEGARPASASPPADSEQVLLAWFRGAPAEISVLTTYELYPDYDPDRERRGIEACVAMDWARRPLLERVRYFLRSNLNRLLGLPPP